MRALAAQKAVAAAEAQHSRSKSLPAFAFSPFNFGAWDWGRKSCLWQGCRVKFSLLFAPSSDKLDV